MDVSTFWNKNKFHGGSKENRATEFFYPLNYYFFLMLQSQKYLQVCNSLQCTSSVHFKLAAPQIKSCHIIPIVIPLLPAQEIIRFQMSENESKGVTLLFCQVSNIVGAII